MAGTFEEAQAQIRSLQPGQLRSKAGELREFGIDTRLAGSELGASADEVGAQRGAPYAAYRYRLGPTASWLRGVAGPALDTAGGLENAAGAAERAQMVLAQQEQALAALAGSAQPGQFAQAKAAALGALNAAIGEVSTAYAAIAPPPPAAAPVVVSGGGTGPGGRGARVAGAGTGGALAAAEHTGGSGADAGHAVALGPRSGPFAGFVPDPTTGHLIDPATGREVDAGGRFLDPVTGQPFGGPGPFASRLEGLVGGGAPVGLGVQPLGAGVGAGPGVLALAGPGVGPVGGGPAGGFGAAGGVVPLPPPGVVGGIGATGGTRRITRLYGGVVPPSLAGSNPAGEQLQRIAAQNLEQKAAVAQRYAAIASGQPTSGYGYLPPPMAGVGGGGTGAARSARSAGSRAVTEPAGVWGAATGGGGWPGRRRTGQSGEVEDDDVWTGGDPVSALLDGR